MNNIFDYLILIATFFLSYEQINLGNYDGILKGKPFSLIFLTLFLIFNLYKLFTIKFKIREKLFIIINIILMFISIYISTYTYRDIDGIRSFVNGLIGFLISYLSFRIYFNDADEKKILIFFKTMFNGYLIVSMIFGILEFVYCYIHKYAAIEIFLNYFLPNINFIENGRIHFALAEPTSIATFFYLTLFPAAIYLKYNSKKTSNVIFWVVILLILNLFSYSNAYIISTLIVIILLFLINNKFSIIKKILILSLISICLIFITNFILIKNVFSIKNPYFYRIQGIVLSQSYDQDSSTVVRNELLNYGYKGFLEKPYLGWGSGNFIQSLRENFIPTSNGLANKELEENISNKKASTHSFYLTQLCENGVLGIFLIALIIYTCFLEYKKLNKLKYVPIFIIYILIQNELYGSVIFAMWLAFFNSSTINRKRIVNNNTQKEPML